jgi:two-component system sensor histidine kinase QseC
VVDRHGGEVTLGQGGADDAGSSGGGLRATVRLPLAEAGTPQPLLCS